MQHLDEGTIHSWLDGALTPAEAARVEAHVAECAQCAAAVAEARGFIAASSRILTALDNAPRGVIPVTASRKRVDPMVWRIAATLLVVAGGTLVVVRNRGADEELMSAKTDPITFSSQPTTAATKQAPTATTPAETAPAPASANQASPRAERSDALPIARRRVTTERATAEAGQAARAPDLLQAPISAPTLARSKVGAAVAMDAAAKPQLLKVVGSPRRIGARVTLYEVAPGDTVTLTESIPMQLSEVVVSGATSAPTAQNTRDKSAAASTNARADMTATSAKETRARVGVAASAPTAPPSAPEGNPIHTITWTDSATRGTFSLSGRMPEARLQEIRIRIESERAAAAKKNP
jgi:hypothetical protein